MLTLKEISKEPNKKILQNKLDLTSLQLDAFLELFVKGKIAKPDVLFSKGLTRVNPTEKYDFTYLETQKQSNFFWGLDLSLENVDNKIKKIQKEIDKAKKPLVKIALELEQAFYHYLNACTLKAFAKGKLKFVSETTTTEGTTIFMQVVPNSIDAKKRVEKEGVPEILSNFHYTTKNGALIQVVNEEVIGNEIVEEVAVSNEANVPNSNLIKELEQALTKAKQRGHLVKLLQLVDTHLKDKKMMVHEATLQGIRKTIMVELDMKDLENALSQNNEKNALMDLLQTIDKYIKDEAFEKQKKDLSTYKKTVLSTYLKQVNGNIQQPENLQIELQRIVVNVERTVETFVQSDFLDQPTFIHINKAHSAVYNTVMGAHSTMNTLMKLAKVDWQEGTYFDDYKKPISLALKRATMIRNECKLLAKSDATIRALVEKRATQPDVQVKINELFDDVELRTQKLLTFMAKM